MLSKELFDVLGGEKSHFHGVTFTLTKNNKFIETLNTPNLFGHDPSVNNYIPAGRNLVNSIKDLISEAKHSVDISTLTPYPDGDFLDAIRDGIYASYEKGNRPVIRVLKGYYAFSRNNEARIENLQDQLAELINKRSDAETTGIPHFTPTASMKTFIKDLALPRDLKLYVGAMQSDWGSWNHSKLIIVDGKECITGGHNLWNEKYLRFAPIHDLSVRLSGPSVKCSENFLNCIWTEIARFAGTSNRTKWYWSMLSYNGTVENGKALAEINSDVTNTEVLALGRIGSKLTENPDKASNASQTVRVEAVKRAKNHVRLSQQMLGIPYIGYDEELISALSKLIVEGKQVSIIISDKGAKDNTDASYAGNGVEDTALHIAKKVKSLMSGSDISSVRKLLASNLHVSPLRFFDKNGNQKYKDDWKWRSDNGKRAIEPGNHAKAYIIDNEAFYVGSDNAYAPPFSNGMGLQEFGFMFFGEEATDKFMKDYWDKSWYYSQQFEFKEWSKFS